MYFEFMFAITGERKRDTLFDGNNTLKITPIDSIVTIKERNTFKVVRNFENCPIYAALVVKSGEKDAGFGVDSVWQSSLLGGSDPILNSMHTDYGLHL